MDVRNLLQAQFIVRNNQMILTKYSKDTLRVFDDSYVYAVSHSIYPIIHEPVEFGTGDEPIQELINLNPFFPCYEVGYKEVRKVFHYLDEKYRAGDTPNTNDLDIMFNPTDGINLLRVGYICRYLYLNSRFDKKFFNDFESKSSSEIHGITENIDPERDFSISQG